MTTSVKRPKTSAKRRPRQRFRWLGVALAVGIIGGLVSLAFAFDLQSLLLSDSTETATTPSMAILDPAPAADAPTGPTEPPVEVKKIESAPPAPAPVTEKEPDSVPAPMPEPPPAVVGKVPELPYKLASDKELCRQLLWVPEFGLKPGVRDNMVESYKTNYQSSAVMGRKPIFDPGILLKHMPSALQLPVRTFPVCQLPPDNAVMLGVLSRKLHAYLDVLAPKDATGKRSDPKRLRTALRQERRGRPPEWLRPEALPAMTQILMAEDVPLRLILVDMMAEIKGRAASIRLAQRAVYDLSHEVRKAAIDALRQRPADEARRTLVDAMRYPWPAAADHAADALEALGERDAAPLLVALLEKPDPAAPFATKTGASVRELVRVNHVENCMLCHVPAVGRDPVTDVDPFARRPDQTYRVGGYGGPQLPGGGGGGVWANKVLIRADVQFLRQDFSITFPPGSNHSSGGLRFDFLVRTRPLQPAEVQEWRQQTRAAAPVYPQREATLRALRTVTGQDVGSTTEAWLKLYPHASAEAEGVRLSAALRSALPDQREQLLARYRDAKEEHHTEGLAYAIPHVKGKFQEKVRAALIQRMTRLSADELRAYLEREGELREAAARACVRKADPEMIPDLIGLLADADADVRESALQALRRLTSQDFGPPAGCSPMEREAAVAKWQEWHRQNRS